VGLKKGHHDYVGIGTTQLEGDRIGVLGVLANERAIRAWCKRVQASGLHYFDPFLTTLERWIMGSSM
jgi:hypothetical protein